MNEVGNFTAEDTRIFGRPFGFGRLDSATGLEDWIRVWPAIRFLRGPFSAA